MAEQRRSLEPVLVDGRWVLHLRFGDLVWSSRIVRRTGRSLREAYSQALRALSSDQREALARARLWRQIGLVRRPDGAEVLIFQRVLMVLKVDPPPDPKTPEASGVVDLMDALRTSLDEARKSGEPRKVPRRSPRKEREPV